RAGTLTSRYYGDSDELIGEYAWCGNLSSQRTLPVGSLKPNDFGLFDMLGNVNVWCQERYVRYPSDSRVVTEGREDMMRVLDSVPRTARGGSFRDQHLYVRSAVRSNAAPGIMRQSVGFRVARTQR
ncbi:MAG: formylglycine-generating enzyme family protein, partial [Planctomycetaceae bacterium]